MDDAEAATPPEPEAQDSFDPTPGVLMFRSLADPARLLILRHLVLGEHRVVDLTAHVGLAQSTTSAHLTCLKDCGLVTSRTAGRSSYYALAAGPELLALLAASERLLAATGSAVVLCPTWIDTERTVRGVPARTAPPLPSAPTPFDRADPASRAADPVSSRRSLCMGVGDGEKGSATRGGGPQVGADTRAQGGAPRLVVRCQVAVVAVPDHDIAAGRPTATRRLP